MNNATKAIIILSIVIVILLVVLVWGIFDNRKATQRYRQLIEERNRGLEEIGDLTDKLDGKNQELRDYKRQTDGIISELNGTITRNREIIKSLLDVSGKIQGTNSTAREKIERARQILREVLAWNN